MTLVWVLCTMQSLVLRMFAVAANEMCEEVLNRTLSVQWTTIYSHCLMHHQASLQAIDLREGLSSCSGHL